MVRRFRESGSSREIVSWMPRSRRPDRSNCLASCFMVHFLTFPSSRWSGVRGRRPQPRAKTLTPENPRDSRGSSPDLPLGQTRECVVDEFVNESGESRSRSETFMQQNDFVVVVVLAEEFPE